MKKIVNAAFLVLILTMVLTVSGCRTVDPVANTHRAAWAEYTEIPNKDYTVIGAVVVRSASILTLNADLMERAIALGAHDIINVRVDTQRTGDGITRVVAGSAVAIRYTDDTYYPDLRVILRDSFTMADTPDPSEEAPSKRVWYNPFSWFRKAS